MPRAKTLDALKVVLKDVVVDRWTHYQGLVRRYHYVVHEGIVRPAVPSLSVRADVPSGGDDRRRGRMGSPLRR